MTKLNKTFIIVNKDTQEQYHADSGKSSWKQIGHAKCAFANSYYKNSRDPLLKDFNEKLDKHWDRLKFNDQDVYEVVELKSKDTLTLDKIKELVYSYHIVDVAESLSASDALVLEIKNILKGEN